MHGFYLYNPIINAHSNIITMHMHSCSTIESVEPPGPIYDVPKPDLSDLIKELYTTVSDKWETIGLLLGIESSRLDIIKAEENHVPQSCLREMLKIWLRRVSPPPTWAAVADAVESLGDQELAIRLRRKYCNTT